MITVELAGGPCDGNTYCLSYEPDQAPFFIEQQWADNRSRLLSRPDSSVIPMPIFQVVRYRNTGRVTPTGALVYQLERTR